MNHDPYTPPSAVVEDARLPLGEDVLIANGRSRPIHHGWKWIATGWELFKRQPGMWVLCLVSAYGAMGVVPWIVRIFSASLMLPAAICLKPLWPIVTAGFVAVAHAAFRGERFNVGDLFAGCKRHTSRLVMVGFINLAVFAAILATLTAAIGADSAFGLFTGKVSPISSRAILTAFVFYYLAISLWGIAVAFAPALVYLNDITVLKAIRMSAAACLKNIFPGLLFIVLFSILMVLSALPLLLGLLVSVPVGIAALYGAYRDIFLQPAQS